ARTHVDVVVQGRDVPRAEVVAVVTPRRVARCHAEVADIPRRATPAPVVIPGDGASALLVPAPRGRIAGSVITRAAVGIGVIPQCEHRAWDRVEDARRRRRVGRTALRDIPGAHEDLRRPWCRDDRGEGVGSGATVGADDAHPYGEGTGLRVPMRGGDECRAGIEGRRVDRAVTPADGPRAWPSAYCEPGREGDRLARRGIQVWPRVHRGEAAEAPRRAFPAHGDEARQRERDGRATQECLSLRLTSTICARTIRV